MRSVETCSSITLSRITWEKPSHFMACSPQVWMGNTPRTRASKTWPRTTSKRCASFNPLDPYFIGGRSLGGMIAFEMARQLRAQGQEIGLLALLDTYPSGYAKLLRDQTTLRARFDRAVSRTKAHLANLKSLSLPDKVLYLVAKSKFAPRKMKSHVWRRVYSSFANLGRPLPRALAGHQRIELTSSA